LSNLKSIAVVEDDASLLAALENLIGAHGLDVHGFANAEAFLAQRDCVEIDCLITDVQMDGSCSTSCVRPATLHRSYSLRHLRMSGYTGRSWQLGPLPISRNLSIVRM
jgi:FixJ family two-component response regulator